MEAVHDTKEGNKEANVVLAFRVFVGREGLEDFDEGKEEFSGVKSDFVIGMGKNVPNAIQT